VATQTLCSISGCGNSGKLTRDMCSMHYQRWQRGGDPERVSRIRGQKGTICSADGCEREAVCKRLCTMHYSRLVKFGDHTIASRANSYRSNIRWIEENAGFAGDECLIWPFGRNETGRGVVRRTSAPRAMCTEAHGAPPSNNHHAAHSCGNGHIGCVNPRHLRWATPAENERDKLVHGTLRRGEAINTSKLSPNDVLAIRRSALSGVALARQFGVTPAAISSIRTRKAWAWLE
jgi:hypothetical protein